MTHDDDGIEEYARGPGRRCALVVYGLLAFALALGLAGLLGLL